MIGAGRCNGPLIGPGTLGAAAGVSGYIPFRRLLPALGKAEGTEAGTHQVLISVIALHFLT